MAKPVGDVSWGPISPPPTPQLMGAREPPADFLGVPSVPRDGTGRSNRVFYHLASWP